MSQLITRDVPSISGVIPKSEQGKTWNTGSSSSEGIRCPLCVLCDLPPPRAHLLTVSQSVPSFFFISGVCQACALQSLLLSHHTDP